MSAPKPPNLSFCFSEAIYCLSTVVLFQIFYQKDVRFEKVHFRFTAAVSSNRLLVINTNGKPVSSKNQELFTPGFFVRTEGQIIPLY